MDAVHFTIKGDIASIAKSATSLGVRSSAAPHIKLTETGGALGVECPQAGADMAVILRGMRLPMHMSRMIHALCAYTGKSTTDNLYVYTAVEADECVTVYDGETAIARTFLFGRQEVGGKELGQLRVLQSQVGKIKSSLGKIVEYLEHVHRDDVLWRSTQKLPAWMIILGMIDAHVSEIRDVHAGKDV